MYNQEDIDNGTVMKIGSNYYLSTDVEKVLVPRISPVEMEE